MFAAAGGLQAQTGGEKITTAVMNRDRKWLDLESVAKLEKTFQVDTPLGKSPRIYQMRYKEVPFYYLPRYGDTGSGEILSASDEQFPGQRTVQLWVTLMTLGVRDVIHGNIIGGLNDKLNLDDMVIIDDFIDLKPNHPQSILPYFYKNQITDDWKKWGTRMNPVVCPELRQVMYDQALKYHHARVHYGGTLAQTRTDRWETPAEVRMLKTLGADVTCTLDGTYIVYAKQAGIHYATAQIVMNFGEGLRPNDVANTSEEGFARIAKSLRMTLLESVYALRNYHHNCLCFRLRNR